MKYFLPVALALIGLAVPAAAAAPAARPNIIFLLTDDQRDNSLGAMGHPFVKTPHLDALLRDSVRFRNAYAPTPVCSPSRVSYFTGLTERVHGVGFSSAYELTEAQWERTYPALLRRAGYYTGFVGKFGVEYYTFRGRAAEKFDYWWGHDGWTRFLPKDTDTPSTKPYHRAKADLITPIMGEAMAEFLDRAPAGKPFCLSVSFNVPHGSQTTSMHAAYPEWHRMTRPANENPALKGSPFYDTLYRDLALHIPEETATAPDRLIPRFILDQDKGRKTTYAYNYDRATCLEHHIRYYQTITGLDHVIGGLVADLKRRGLDRNTVIIYGSDHGLIMGEYGMGGKELLLDLAAKIPSFVHDPRAPRGQRGRTLDQLVSGIDYTRTILDYAGVSAPAEMEGRSLRPLVEGNGAGWRDELHLESLFALRDNPFQEGIRTARWKYIRMYDGVHRFLEHHVDFRGRAPEFELLFDLAADPGERSNLAADPAHAAVLAELRAKVAAESVARNDRRAAYVRAFSPAPRNRPRRKRPGRPRRPGVGPTTRIARARRSISRPPRCPSAAASARKTPRPSPACSSVAAQSPSIAPPRRASSCPRSVASAPTPSKASSPPARPSSACWRAPRSPRCRTRRPARSRCASSRRPSIRAARPPIPPPSLPLPP